MQNVYLEKAGQKVNSYPKMLEFRKLSWIVTHSKYGVNESLAVVFERVDLFPYST